MRWRIFAHHNAIWKNVQSLAWDSQQQREADAMENRRKARAAHREGE